jgi:nicotinate-nucleotide adenylyltransferase
VSERLGLYGGTFNPIHMGHLRLAEDVRETFSLDRILFVPTNIPPHKPLKQNMDPRHRFNMVNMAIQENKAFLCEDIELKRGGSSYTVDTVSYVYEQYSFEDRPFFILGSDLMPELHTWKKVKHLVNLVHFIVLVRANYPFVSSMCDGIMGLTYSLYEKRKIEINSSEIRDLVWQGKSIRYLVTDQVLAYIEDNGLYRNQGRGSTEDSGDSQ